jgi:hypothetical protein
MSRYAVLLGTFFGKLTRSLKGQIVGDVPPDYALCEFDCRKTQCQFNEWLHCPNRLSYLALEARLAATIPDEQAQASIEVPVPASAHRQMKAATVRTSRSPGCKTGRSKATTRRVRSGPRSSSR